MDDNLDRNTLNLWNEYLDGANYGSKEQYNEHIMEQYKIYLEMADRVGARRNVANSFFLTLNTLVLGVVGYTYEKGPLVPNPWLNIFPLLLGLWLCYIWYKLIKSYQQLSSAKFKIIGEYEQRLPSSPYWKAEWITLLGEGKKPEVYNPLTGVEQGVPTAFAAIYLMSFVALLVFG